MPFLEDITYSRELTIIAIRKYYQFLVTLYLDESSVIYPPSGGWPEIKHATPEVLAKLGKTEEVVSLLAELPYIHACAPPGIHGAPENCFADWRDAFQLLESGGDGEGLRLLSEGFEFYNVAPPHVIGLTLGSDNDIFVLDTKLGIVSWYEPPGACNEDASRERILDDPEDYAPEIELDWRYGTASWAIPDFFELLKDQYRELHFIPLSQCTVMSTRMTPRQDDMISELRQLYHDYGWPEGEHYRKDECMKAVAQMLRLKYPNQADWRNNY